MMMMVMRAFLVDLRTAHTLHREVSGCQSARDQDRALTSVGPRAEPPAGAEARRVRGATSKVGEWQAGERQGGAHKA